MKLRGLALSSDIAKGAWHRKCIKTGLGLLLFIVTMIGGPVRVGQAQDDQGVTLASLAGKYAAKFDGFLTICLSAGVPISCSSVSPVPTPVALNFREILQSTRDAAGNSCAVNISTTAPVSGTKLPANVNPHIDVFTNTSFDPKTGAGTESVSSYHGGSCNGAAFDNTGATLTATGTFSFVVSDSGNRIESIVKTFSSVTSAFSVAGSVKGVVISGTFIRQSHSD